MIDKHLSQMAEINSRMITDKIDRERKLHRLDNASNTYKIVAEYIQEFESTLDENHEIGGRLVSFGQVVSFHIQNIGYYNPDIITFYGVNEKDERLHLIQHVSQLNVLLIAMKKKGEKAVRIGFTLRDHEV